jgi:hypothetical protein
MPNQIRNARKGINLIRKRGKRGMDDLAWYIGKHQSGKTFYVADYDDDNNTIMWAGSKKDSISFKTERAVHRFIQTHLHNRTDIILVQAPVH